MEGGRAPSAYLSATKGRDALLIRGFGALCMGTTQSDAKAVATLLEKNAKAALLALDAPQVRPLPLLDSHLMRFVYTHKYSKLAEADPPSTPSPPGQGVTESPRHGEEV
jgi:ribulose-5-phosphate 4-epimerase/fuculose-1-phosphate aldolase